MIGIEGNEAAQTLESPQGGVGLRRLSMMDDLRAVDFP